MTMTSHLWVLVIGATIFCAARLIAAWRGWF